MRLKPLMNKIVRKIVPAFFTLAVLLGMPVNSMAAQALPTMPPSGYDQARNNIPTGRSTVLLINHQQQKARGRREFTCHQDIQQATNTAFCIYYTVTAGVKVIGLQAEAQPMLFWITLLPMEKIQPFIIVTPNVNTSSISDSKLPDDILNSLIPYIDSHYSVYTDRLHRAIAVFRMVVRNHIILGVLI